MEQTTKINLLYDFYSSLLTDKQRSLLELYYQDDWSLGEIAEHQGVSRQAVFEAIKRAQGMPEDLEDKLKLMEKHFERQNVLNILLKRLEDIPEAKDVFEPMLKQLLDID